MEAGHAHVTLDGLVRPALQRIIVAAYMLRMDAVTQRLKIVFAIRIHGAAGAAGMKPVLRKLKSSAAVNAVVRMEPSWILRAAIAT
jgi:hypothetical protein